jgi:hypothetical protein
MRDELGVTLRNKAEKNVPSHEKMAKQALAKVPYTPAELMNMWDQQKKTQLSVRSRTFPPCVVALDVVLTYPSFTQMPLLVSRRNWMLS